MAKSPQYLGDLNQKAKTLYARTAELTLALSAIHNRKATAGPPAKRGEVARIVKKLQTLEHLAGVMLVKAKAVEKALQPPAKALKLKK